MALGIRLRIPHSGESGLAGFPPFELVTCAYTACYTHFVGRRHETCRLVTASVRSRDHGRGTHFTTQPMTCTAFAWVLVLLFLPVVVLFWATESRHTRIQRLRRNGATWKQIAERYNVSTTTARRWSYA